MNNNISQTEDANVHRGLVSFVKDAARRSECVSDEVIVRINTTLVRITKAISIRIADSHAKIGAQLKEDLSRLFEYSHQYGLIRIVLITEN